MYINEDFYQNSLAKHPINFFSVHFDKINEKYNQIEGTDLKITKLIKIMLKTLGLFLDIVTAPIRLPLKVSGMLYSKLLSNILSSSSNEF